jgi:mycothiol system anti-sigma-R factor
MTMIPCEEVARLLWQYMDRELDEPTYRRLQEHIRQCRDCSPRHDFEMQLQAIIQQKCRGEAAPESLRRRLRAMLQDL